MSIFSFLEGFTQRLSIFKVVAHFRMSASSFPAKKSFEGIAYLAVRSNNGKPFPCKGKLYRDSLSGCPKDAWRPSM